MVALKPSVADSIVGMNAPHSPSTTEERTVAILFCEVTAFDSSARGLRDVLTPPLRDSFANRFAHLLKRHRGTFVTAVEDTSIAIFQSASAAVELASSLQADLAGRPISAEYKTLRARICIHYASVIVEETYFEPISLAERVSVAMDSPLTRDLAPRRVKIMGKAVSFAARLLPRTPDGAIALSDEVMPRLHEDLAKFFAKQAPQGNGISTPGDGSPKFSGGEPPLWVDKNHHAGPPNVSGPTPPRPENTQSSIRFAEIPPATQIQNASLGMILQSRYELLAMIGKGGTGAVYRAKDVLLGREVAIKALTGMTLDLHKRFFIEIRTVADLNHPNIVSIYDVAQQDDTSFIIMELLRGSSLAEVLASARKMSPTQKIDVIVQTCRGLAHAHSRGIIHRDIKPANILLLPNGQVKILDFGEARLDSAPADAATGHVVGTFGYISPERLKGAPGDARADIWSAGVVLYQLLTGRLPFPGDELSTMFKILDGQFEPLSKFASNYPPALNDILSRALAKNPAERYTTAEEMASALAQAEGDVGPGSVAPMNAEMRRGSVPTPSSSKSGGLIGQLTLKPAPASQPTATPDSGEMSIPPMFPTYQTAQAPVTPPPTPMKPGETRSNEGFDLSKIETSGSTVDYASEAIAVIDIVQATATSDLFGWYSVGRHSVRHLRNAVRQIGSLYGLACMKSTGDGLLLTYRDDKAADLAAVNAVQASIDLLRKLSEYNKTASEERQIAIRLALHFGEVDVLPDDREGPNVSFAFRVEAVNHASLDKALNPIDPALLPLRDYILCSERIHDIAVRRKPEWHHTSCGLFKLQGFSSWHELFLVSGQPRVDA
jgi:serine/threonine protein kinase